MSRKKKIAEQSVENSELTAVSMFQLEERVLFDGAAVADIVAAEQQAQAEIEAQHEADNAQDNGVNQENSGAGPVDDGPGSLSDYLEVASSGNIAVQTALEASTQIKVLFVADIDRAEALASSADEYNIIISFDPSSTTSAQLLDALNSALEGGKADAIGFMVDPATQGAMEAFSSEAGTEFWDGVNNALNAQGSIDLFGDADDTNVAENIAASYDRNVTVSTMDNSGNWDQVQSFEGEGFGSDLEDSVNLDDSLFEDDFLSSLDLLTDNPTESREVAFISRDTNNIEDILNGLGEDVDIVILDPSQDAIQQITDYLNDTTDVQYDTLHFFAPGSTDAFNFNGENISAADLADFSNELVSWRNTLTDHATINIYGGDMAGTEGGRDFLDHLMAATGAEIEVSNAFAGLDMAFMPDYDLGNVNDSAAEVLDYAYNIQRGPNTYYVVNTADSGEGSLRWALEQANFNEGLDYIEFQLDDGSVIDINSYSLYITDSVIINSSNMNITINGSAMSDSLFVVDDGDAATQITVEMNNVTLRGAERGDMNNALGGAIQNHEALTLNGVVIQNSDAQRGGAIWNDVDAKVNIELSDAITNHDLYFASEPREVVFISTAVANSDEILSSLRDKSNIEIVILESGSDAIQQISDYLNNSDAKFDAVHILTHGTDGQLVINGQIIDADTVSANIDSIASWSNGMNEGADIHFYGCDLAAGKAGEQMLQLIANATGADIAASTDTTGVSGNWDLEYTIGTIQTTGLQFDIDFNLATYTSVATGNWNDAATWGLGTGTVTITTADEVIISAGTTVTINTAGAESGNITVASGGTLNMTAGDLTVAGSVTVNGRATLGDVTVSGSMTVARLATLELTGTYTFGGHSFAIGNAVMDGSTIIYSGTGQTILAGNYQNVQLNGDGIFAGTTTFYGNVTLGTGVTAADYDVSQDVTYTGTLAAAQTVAALNYNGTLTLQGNTQTAGDVSADNIILDGNATHTILAGGTLLVDGGSLTHDGRLVASGTLQFDNNATWNINSSGVFNSSTGTVHYLYAPPAGTIPELTYNNLTIEHTGAAASYAWGAQNVQGTLTIDGNITLAVTGTLNNVGGLVVTNSAVLNTNSANIGGDITVSEGGKIIFVGNLTAAGNITVDRSEITSTSGVVTANGGTITVRAYDAQNATVNVGGVSANLLVLSGEIIEGGTHSRVRVEVKNNTGGLNISTLNAGANNVVAYTGTGVNQEIAALSYTSLEFSGGKKTLAGNIRTVDISLGTASTGLDWYDVNQFDANGANVTFSGRLVGGGVYALPELTYYNLILSCDDARVIGTNSNIRILNQMSFSVGSTTLLHIQKADIRTIFVNGYNDDTSFNINKSGTVIYDRAGNQSVLGKEYANLVFGKADLTTNLPNGTYTFLGDVSVLGSFVGVYHGTFSDISIAQAGYTLSFTGNNALIPQYIAVSSGLQLGEVHMSGASEKITQDDANPFNAITEVLVGYGGTAFNANSLIFDDAATLRVGTTINVTTTFTHGGGTIDYYADLEGTSDTTQTIGRLGTNADSGYYNLTISGSGNKQLLSDITIYGNFSRISGEFNQAQFVANDYTVTFAYDSAYLPADGYRQIANFDVSFAGLVIEDWTGVDPIVVYASSSFKVTGAADGTGLELGENTELRLFGVVAISGGTHDIAGTSTVHYAASGSDQIMAVLNYGNLKFSGGGQKNWLSGTSYTGTLTVDSGTYTGGNADASYDGAHGTQLLVASGSTFAASGNDIYLVGGQNSTTNAWLGATLTFAGNIVAGTGSTIYAGIGSENPNGRNSTVVYQGSSNQTIFTGDYYNLTFGGSGSRTLEGDIKIAGAFDVSNLSSSFVAGTNVVTYNGDGNQTIANTRYYQIELDGEGVKKWIGGSWNTTTDALITFLVDDVTLQITENSLFANANVNIENESATPGVYLGTIEYYGNDLDIIAGSRVTYNNLILTLNEKVGANFRNLTDDLTVTNNFTIGDTVVFNMAGHDVSVDGNLTLIGSTTAVTPAKIWETQINLQGGDLTVDGNFTMGSRSSFSDTSASTFTLGGNWTNNNTQTVNGVDLTTITVNGAVVLGGSTAGAQNLTRNFIFNDLEITDDTLLTFNGNIEVHGTVTSNNDGSVDTAANTTFSYLGTGDQLILRGDYYDLILDGGDKETDGGIVNVGNELEIASGVTFTVNVVDADATASGLVINDNGNVILAGELELAANAIVNLNADIDGTGGTLTLNSGSKFTFGGADFSSLSTLNSEDDSTFTYNGANQIMAVGSGYEYGELHLAGTGIKTADGNVDVYELYFDTDVELKLTSGTLILDSSVDQDVYHGYSRGTVHYADTNDGQLVLAAQYYNLVLSGGDKVGVGSGELMVAGVFDVAGLSPSIFDATGITIVYNGSDPLTTQTILTGNILYGNIRLEGNNKVVNEALVLTGDLTFSNDLSLTLNGIDSNGDSLVVAGDIIRQNNAEHTIIFNYTGTGTQNVADRDDYYNLVLNGSAKATIGSVEAANDISLNADWSITGALTTTDLIFGGSETLIVGGDLTVSGVLTAATGTIILNGINQTVSIGSGNYYNLILAGSDTTLIVGDMVVNDLWIGDSNTVDAVTVNARNVYFMNRADSSLSNGVLELSGGSGATSPWVVANTLEIGNGTVVYDGSNQLIMTLRNGNAVEYYNLIVEGSGTKNATSALEVANNFAINDGVSVNATSVEVGEDLTFEAASGGILYLNAAGIVLTVGNNFSAGTGTVVYNGANQNIANLSNAYYNLVATGSGVKTTGALKFENEFRIGNVTITAISVEGTGATSKLVFKEDNLFFDSTGRLEISGQEGLKVDSIVVGKSTIVYNRVGGDQTVAAVDYWNLEFIGSGTRTAAGSVNVGNNLYVLASKDGTPDGDGKDLTITVKITGNLNVNTAGTGAGNVGVGTNITTSTGGTAELIVTGDAAINGQLRIVNGGLFSGKNITLTRLTMSDASTLRVQGALNVARGNVWFGNANSTVIYDGAGPQTITALDYQTLEAAGGGTKSWTNGGNILNRLVIRNGSTFWTDQYMSSTGGLGSNRLEKLFIETNGRLYLAGADANGNAIGRGLMEVQFEKGAIITYGGNIDQNIDDWIDTSTEKNTNAHLVFEFADSRTKTYDGNFSVGELHILGTSGVFGVVTGNLTVNGITINGVAGPARLTFVGNGELQLGGNLTTPEGKSLNFSAGNGTMHFNSDTAWQVVNNLDYYNLKISNANKLLANNKTTTVLNAFTFANNASLLIQGWSLEIDATTGSINGDSGRDNQYFIFNDTGTGTTGGRLIFTIKAGSSDTVTGGSGNQTSSYWNDMWFQNGSSSDITMSLRVGKLGTNASINPETFIKQDFILSYSGSNLSFNVTDTNAGGANYSDYFKAMYSGWNRMPNWYAVDGWMQISGSATYRVGIVDIKTIVKDGDEPLVVVNNKDYSYYIDPDSGGIADRIGTLRFAVEYSNVMDGLQKITFATDFDSASNTIVLENTGLKITDDLVIEGPGSGKVIIDGSKLSGGRLITIVENVGVELSGMTLSNSFGGGILNYGSLIMEDMIIQNMGIGNTSTSFGGGGLYNAAGGSVYGNKVWFYNNQAYVGSAILNEDGQAVTTSTTGSDGKVTTVTTISPGAIKLENLTVEGGNGGSGGYGAIYNGVNSSMIIMNGTVSLNNDHGIVNGGSFYGYNLTIFGNAGYGFINGLQDTNGTVYGQATLENATVAFNGYGSFYKPANADYIIVTNVISQYNSQYAILDENSGFILLTDAFGGNTASTVDYGDHGGWVNTLALKQAIEGYNDTGASKFDARGYMVNGGRDYGAYEFKGYVAFNQTRPEDKLNFYTSIQEAIDNARAGETIELMNTRILVNGTIEIKKDIMIVGHGEGNTVIDNVSGKNGGQAVVTFVVNDGNDASKILVSLQGMSLWGHGQIRGNGGLIQNYENLVLNEMELRGGAATNGGALYNAGNMVIYRTVFSDNWATQNGGAIYNAGKGLLEMNNVTISENQAGGMGGGLYSSNDSTVSMTNVTVDFNYSVGNGGGLYMIGTKFTANNLTVANNITLTGNGSGIFGSGNWVLTNVTVAYNESWASGDTGYGLAFDSGAFHMSNSLIVYNHNAQYLGMNTWYNPNIADSDLLIFNSLSSEYDINDTSIRSKIFSSKHLKDYGGWVRTLALSEDFALSSYNSGVTSGALEHDARGYLVNGHRDLGAFEYQGYIGTLYYKYVNDTNQYSQGIYDLNQLNSYLASGTVEGEAAFVFVNSRVLSYDVNLSMWTKTTSDTAPLRSLNINMYGHAEGGTVLSGGKMGKLLTVSASSYMSGTSVVGVFGTLTFDRITFADGIAWNGAAMSFNGSGAVKEAVGKIVITDSQFINNVAFGDGGAIFVDTKNHTIAGFTVDISNSTFAYNIAMGSGGAIFAGQAVTINTSTLVYNTALEDGGAIIIAVSGSEKGSLTMNYSTVSFNTANRNGGAIMNNAAITSNASIIAKNRSTAYNTSYYTGGYDYYAGSIDGITAAGRNNIIESQNGRREYEDVDPKQYFAIKDNSKAQYPEIVNYFRVEDLYHTGMLADLGGWSQTIELAWDSFAKDKMNVSGLYDQRGYGINEWRDIGAYEAGGTYIYNDGVYYNSIQEAINDAKAGDVLTMFAVRVKESNINITKNITIQVDATEGTNRVRAKQLFIDAEYYGRVFSNNTGKTFNLSDAYLYNGVSMSASSDFGMISGGNGGLIFNTGTMTLTNVSGAHSFALSSGGAIYNNGTLEIIANGNRGLLNTIFAFNSAGFTGGAIYSSGLLTLKGATGRDTPAAGKALYFRYNRAEDGGGIYLDSNSLDASDVYMIGNSASINGGAVYAKDLTQDDTVKFNMSTFDYNGARNDGGGIYMNGGSLNITDTFMRYNMAFASGGAIYAQDNVKVTLYTADSTVKKKTYIFDNDALTGDGGGVYLLRPSEVEIYAERISESVDFYSNYSQGGRGGGLYVSGDKKYTTVTMHQVAFYDNHAVNGGGLYIDNVDRVDIGQNSMFAYNSTLRPLWSIDGESGGAMYLYNINKAYFNDIEKGFQGNITIIDNDADIHGGGIYFEDVSDIYMRNVQLGNNTSTTAEGGGIYIIGNTESIHLVEIDAYSNYAGGYYGWVVDNTINGGAFYIDAVNARILVENSGFDANSALDGAGMYIERAISAEFISSTFGENFGGALYINTLSEGLTLNFVTFGYNQISKSYLDMNSAASALYYNSGSLTVANSIFYEEHGTPIVLGSGVKVVKSNNNIFYRSEVYSLSNSGTLFSTATGKIEAYRWNALSGQSAVVRDANGNIIGSTTVTNEFIKDNLYLSNNMNYQGNSLTRTLALESRDSIASHYYFNGQETYAGSVDGTVIYDQRGNMRSGVSILETLYYFDKGTMWLVTRNSRSLEFVNWEAVTGDVIEGTKMSGVTYRKVDGQWTVEINGQYSGTLNSDLAFEVSGTEVKVSYVFYRPDAESSTGWYKVTVADGKVTYDEASASEINKVGGMTVGMGAFEPNFYMVVTSNEDNKVNPDWYLIPEGSYWHSIDANLTGYGGDVIGVSLRDAIYWIDSYTIVDNTNYVDENGNPIAKIIDKDGNYLNTADSNNSSNRFIIDGDRYVKFADKLFEDGNTTFVLSAGHIEIHKDVAIGMVNDFKGWSEFRADNTFQAQDSANRIIIDGNDTSRLFYIVSESDYSRDNGWSWTANAALNNLTLQNGKRDGTASLHESFYGKGGAIINDAVLILNNVVIKDSLATNSGSTADVASSSGFGGAIYNSSIAELYMYDTTLINNMAEGIDIHNCTTVGFGGAIYNAGYMEIYRSAIIGNTAKGFGASTTDSRGLNTGKGGGLYMAGGTAKIYASTITQNQVTREGGPGDIRDDDGAAFYMVSGNVLMVGNTVAYNDVTIYYAGEPSSYAMFITGGNLTLRNNIIANNMTKDITSPQRKDFYWSSSGTLNGGNNIIGYQNGYAISSFQIESGYLRNILGDINTGIVTSLNMASRDNLKYNGGMTQNYRLGAGSVAIGYGHYTADAQYDQRGLTSDLTTGQQRSTIGAYELLTYVEAESSQIDKALTNTGITYDYGFYVKDGVVEIGRNGWNYNLRNALYLADEGATVKIKIIEGSETFTLAEDAGALQIFNSITVTAYDPNGGDLRLIVDGGNNSRAFIIDDSGADVPSSSVLEVTLKGFNIINTTSGDGNGGAILTSGNLTLIDMSIKNSTAGGDGGAVFVSGKLTVDNVSISDTSAAGLGGAIFVNAGEMIANQLVTNNTSAISGGAVYISNGVGVTINNSSFTNATAISGNGGALFLAGGQSKITNTVLTDNKAAVDGGSIYFRGTALILDGVAIGNTVDLNMVNATRGGAIFMGSGNIDMLNTTISNNNASLYGGGIYFSTINGNVTMNFVTLANNTAGAGTGGGLYLERYANLYVTNSLIAGNKGNGVLDEIYAAANYTLNSFTGNVIGVTNLSGINPDKNYILEADSDYSWLDGYMTKVDIDGEDRFTWVVMMSENSPAKGFVPDSGDVEYDQTGQGRPRQNATAGAYEMNPEPVYKDVYLYVGGEDGLNIRENWQIYDTSLGRFRDLNPSEDFSFLGEGKIFVFDDNYTVTSEWFVANENKVALYWTDGVNTWGDDIVLTVNSDLVNANFDVGGISTLVLNNLSAAGYVISLASVSASSFVEYNAKDDGQQVLTAKDGTKYGTLTLSGGNKFSTGKIDVVHDMKAGANLVIQSGSLTVGGNMTVDGDKTVTADAGSISVAHTLTGGGSLKASGNITANGLTGTTSLGSVNAGGSVSLTGSTDISLSGNVSAGSGNVTMTGSSVTVGSGVTAGGAVNITGTNGIAVNAGGVNAGGNIALTGNGISIVNNVKSTGGSVNVNAGSGNLNLTNGQMVGATGTNISGEALNLSAYELGTATQSISSLNVKAINALSDINTINHFLKDGETVTAAITIADAPTELRYNVGSANVSLGVTGNNTFNLTSINNNGGTFGVITSSDVTMNNLNMKDNRSLDVFKGTLYIEGHDVISEGDNNFDRDDIKLSINNTGDFVLDKNFLIRDDFKVNNIRVKGPEAGVTVQSTRGSVIIGGTVTADGHNFTVDAADMAQIGSVTGVNDLTVKGDTVVINARDISVAGNAAFITGGSAIDLAGTINAGQNVSFSNGINVTSDSAISAAGAINFGTNGSINGTNGADLSLSAGSTVNVANVLMDGSLTVSGGLNVTNNIDGVKNLTINNGVLNVVNGFVDVKGDLSLNGTGNSNVGRELNVGGNFNLNGASGTTTVGGQLTVGNNLNINNANILNANGNTSLMGSLNMGGNAGFTTHTLSLDGTTQQILNVNGKTHITALEMNNVEQMAILNGDLTVDEFTFTGDLYKDGRAVLFKINDGYSLMVTGDNDGGIYNADRKHYFVTGDNAMLKQIAQAGVDGLEFWVGSTEGATRVILTKGLDVGTAYGVGFKNSITNGKDPIRGSLEDTVKGTWNIQGAGKFDVSLEWDRSLNGGNFKQDNAVYNLWINGRWDQGTGPLPIKGYFVDPDYGTEFYTASIAAMGASTFSITNAGTDMSNPHDPSMLDWSRWQWEKREFGPFGINIPNSVGLETWIALHQRMEQNRLTNPLGVRESAEMTSAESDPRRARRITVFGTPDGAYGIMGDFANEVHYIEEEKLFEEDMLEKLLQEYVGGEEVPQEVFAKHPGTMSDVDRAIEDLLS